MPLNSNTREQIRTVQQINATTRTEKPKIALKCPENYTPFTFLLIGTFPFLRVSTTRIYINNSLLNLHILHSALAVSKYQFVLRERMQIVGWKAPALPTHWKGFDRRFIVRHNCQIVSRHSCRLKEHTINSRVSSVSLTMLIPNVNYIYY